MSAAAADDARVGVVPEEVNQRLLAAVENPVFKDSDGTVTVEDVGKLIFTLPPYGPKGPGAGHRSEALSTVMLFAGAQGCASEKACLAGALQESAAAVEEEARLMVDLSKRMREEAQGLKKEVAKDQDVLTKMHAHMPLLFSEDPDTERAAADAIEKLCSGDGDKADEPVPETFAALPPEKRAKHRIQSGVAFTQGLHKRLQKKTDIAWAKFLHAGYEYGDDVVVDIVRNLNKKRGYKWNLYNQKTWK